MVTTYGSFKTNDTALQTGTYKMVVWGENKREGYMYKIDWFYFVTLDDKRRRLEGFYWSASANRLILLRFSVNDILALFSILIPDPISHAT